MIVLDSGIRMWGTPRVLATSLAMAFGANLDSNTTLLAFAAEQTTINAIDLATRDGLTEHLSTLHHELHLGKCLHALKQEAEATGTEAEIVVVTAPETLEDPNFLENLIESKLEPLFIASIGRQGTVELFNFTSTGRKLIKRIEIDVTALASTKPLIAKNLSADFPSILSIHPLPIRLPINGDTTKCRWSIGNEGAISISSDQRLQWWDQKSAYGLQLSTTIRASDVRWVSREPVNGRWQAILGRDGQPHRLLQLDIANLTATEILLDTGHSHWDMFFGHGGYIFATLDSKLFRFSCIDGKVVDSLTKPGILKWSSNRFAFDSQAGTWVAVAVGAKEIVLTPISFRKNNDAIHHVFEHPDIEGPIGIDKNGNLNFSGTGEVRPIGHALGKTVTVESVSADGRQLKLKNDHVFHSSLYRSAIVDVASDRVTNSRRETFEIDKHRDQLIRTAPTRNRFRSIGIRGRHTITLTSRSGTRWDIACVNGDVRLRQGEPTSEWHSSMMFEHAPGKPGERIRLKVAKWGDGSQAWLDSRGLLHLRSSDLTIPEVSFVLTEKPTGGWCSNGNVFGPAHFIEAATKSSQQVFDEVISEFARHLVRSC